MATRRLLVLVCASIATARRLPALARWSTRSALPPPLATEAATAPLAVRLSKQREVLKRKLLPQVRIDDDLLTEVKLATRAPHLADEGKARVLPLFQQAWFLEWYSMWWFVLMTPPTAPLGVRLSLQQRVLGGRLRALQRRLSPFGKSLPPSAALPVYTDVGAAANGGGDGLGDGLEQGMAMETVEVAETESATAETNGVDSASTGVSDSVSHPVVDPTQLGLSLAASLALASSGTSNATSAEAVEMVVDTAMQSVKTVVGATVAFNFAIGFAKAAATFAAAAAVGPSFKLMTLTGGALMMSEDALQNSTLVRDVRLAWENASATVAANEEAARVQAAAAKEAQARSAWLAGAAETVADHEHATAREAERAQKAQAQKEAEAARLWRAAAPPEALPEAPTTAFIAPAPASPGTASAHGTWIDARRPSTAAAPTSLPPSLPPSLPTSLPTSLPLQASAAFGAAAAAGSEVGAYTSTSAVAHDIVRLGAASLVAPRGRPHGSSETRSPQPLRSSIAVALWSVPPLVVLALPAPPALPALALAIAAVVSAALRPGGGSTPTSQG